MSDKQITTHRFEKREGLSFVVGRRTLFRASKASGRIVFRCGGSALTAIG